MNAAVHLQKYPTTHNRTQHNSQSYIWLNCNDSNWKQTQKWPHMPPLGSDEHVPPLVQGLLEQPWSGGATLHPGAASTSSSRTEWSPRTWDNGSSLPLNTISSRQPRSPFTTSLPEPDVGRALPPKYMLVSRLSVRRVPGALPDAAWTWSRTSLA